MTAEASSILCGGCGHPAREGHCPVCRVAPLVAKDPEVGIAIRFIRQYDATADQWPPPFDSTTKEAQRAYNALQSQLLDAPARPRLGWWQRLAFWLYWHLYDRWTYRTRDDRE